MDKFDLILWIKKEITLIENQSVFRDKPADFFSNSIKCGMQIGFKSRHETLCQVLDLLEKGGDSSD